MKNDKILELHKEIDLLQSCITRMAECSFKLKEWYVSLLSIIMTLLVGQKVDMLYVGMFLVGISSIFWGLDSFYLITERRFRWKYAWVLEARMNGNDKYLYDLNPNRVETRKDVTEPTDFYGVIRSKTIAPLYSPFWICGIIIVVVSLIK